MKLGKYSIYFFICFFFNLNQSFSETISNIKIEDLKDLPSTYEEIEEFVEEENVDITETIHQIAHDFSDFAKHRNIEISIVGKNLIQKHINKDLAIILFTNLIKNAIVHATLNSIVKISIEGEKINIENIAETGKLDEQQLFSRFYKVNTRKNSTGLGLAIAKAIAEKYDLKLTYAYQNKHIFTVSF